MCGLQASVRKNPESLIVATGAELPLEMTSIRQGSLAWMRGGGAGMPIFASGSTAGGSLCPQQFDVCGLVASHTARSKPLRLDIPLKGFVRGVVDCDPGVSTPREIP